MQGWTFPGATAKDLFELENEARKTLAQIILGIFGFFAGLLTWWRTRLQDKQVRIMEQGHITDRFTKAVEQLGKMDGDKPNLEVRVGGIYALERIAADSERDHWPIMEILTAYIRRNAPAPTAEDERTPLPNHQRADIQAILLVLGRRETTRDKFRIPLHGTDLRSLHLNNCNFSNSFLILARLDNANLQQADLSGASLMDAKLDGAHLQEAILTDSKLIKASLKSAQLARAILRNTNCTGADFTGADLSDTDLMGAALAKTIGLEPDQLKKARNWQNADYSPQLRRELGLPDSPSRSD